MNPEDHGKPIPIGMMMYNEQPYVCLAELTEWMNTLTWDYDDGANYNGVRQWITEELTLMALAYSSDVKS